MTQRLVYLHYEDGTMAPYNSVEEAMSQASHDAKYGFGVPAVIADKDRKTVHADEDDIRKAADAL